MVNPDAVGLDPTVPSWTTEHMLPEGHGAGCTSCATFTRRADLARSHATDACPFRWTELRASGMNQMLKASLYVTVTRLDTTSTTGRTCFALMAEALDLALAKANGEAMRGAQVLAGLRIHPQHAVAEPACGADNPNARIANMAGTPRLDHTGATAATTFALACRWLIQWVASNPTFIAPADAVVLHDAQPNELGKRAANHEEVSATPKKPTLATWSVDRSGMARVIGGVMGRLAAEFQKNHQSKWKHLGPTKNEGPYVESSCSGYEEGTLKYMASRIAQTLEKTAGDLHDWGGEAIPPFQDAPSTEAVSNGWRELLNNLARECHKNRKDEGKTVGKVIAEWADMVQSTILKPADEAPTERARMDPLNTPKWIQWMSQLAQEEQATNKRQPKEQSGSLKGCCYNYLLNRGACKGQARCEHNRMHKCGCGATHTLDECSDTRARDWKAEAARGRGPPE